MCRAQYGKQKGHHESSKGGNGCVAKHASHHPRISEDFFASLITAVEDILFGTRCDARLPVTNVTDRVEEIDTDANIFENRVEDKCMAKHCLEKMTVSRAISREP